MRAGNGPERGRRPGRGIGGPGLRLLGGLSGLLAVAWAAEQANPTILVLSRKSIELLPGHPWALRSRAPVTLVTILLPLSAR